MRSDARTVSSYLAALPSARRVPLVRLRKVIRKYAPGVQEGMQFGMPTFQFGGFLFAIASQKHTMALYVAELKAVQMHRKSLAKLDCGKSCIRFKKGSDLPLSVAVAIVRDAVRLRRKHFGATLAKSAKSGKAAPVAAPEGTVPKPLHRPAPVKKAPAGAAPRAPKKAPAKRASSAPSRRRR